MDLAHQQVRLQVTPSRYRWLEFCGEPARPNSNQSIARILSGSEDCGMDFSTSIKLTGLGVLLAAASWFSGLYEKNFYLTGYLGYSTGGMECTPTDCKLGVGISNDGYAVDEDVTFELPKGLKPRSIHVSSAYETFVKGGVTVLKLGLVHPDSYKHVLLVYPPSSTIQDSSLQSLDIYSRARTATYDGPMEKMYDPAMPWWMKATFASLATYMLAILLYLLLETPRRRRRRLVKELARADKWHRRGKARYLAKIAALDAAHRSACPTRGEASQG